MKLGKIIQFKGWEKPLIIIDRKVVTDIMVAFLFFSLLFFGEYGILFLTNSRHVDRFCKLIVSILF